MKTKKYALHEARKTLEKATRLLDNLIVDLGDTEEPEEPEEQAINLLDTLLSIEAYIVRAHQKVKELKELDVAEIRLHLGYQHYAVVDFENNSVCGVGKSKEEAVENANIELPDDCQADINTISEEAEEFGLCLIECTDKVYEGYINQTPMLRLSIDTKLISVFGERFASR